MNAHRTTTKRRGAFTMVEMLLASTIAALAATAGATVIYAISSNATETRDYRTQRTAGHYALNVLGRTIREARSIGYVTGDNVALWLDDSNENDRIDVHELGRIIFDTDRSQLVFEYFDDGGAPAPVDAAPTTVFTDQAVLTATMNVTGKQTMILADGVSAASFSGYPDSVEARVVQSKFTIEVNGEPEMFLIAASPRAPADYLFYSESKFAPSARSPRPKRKMLSRWNGFGGGLTAVLAEVLN